MDEIRNGYIRETARMGQFGEKPREARLVWVDMCGEKMMGILGELC